MIAETPAGTVLSDILALCELFTTLTHTDCELIAAGSELRAVPAGTLVLVEGDTGNEMYVLIDGVLEVFKQAGSEEVILQRLDVPGAHVGEMALLGAGDGIRVASVRSLQDSQALAIPRAVFLEALQHNPAIEEHLNVVHHRQLKQLSLVERSVMYRALALFDQEHGWSREEHFEPGEVIFPEGAPPSAVHVVRSGAVKRSRMEDGEEMIVSMLHEGQTFGGLAVFENRPHSAAATALSAVDLVTFDREQFLHATATVPKLHEYLGAIKRIYTMSGGLVTLFDGEFRGEPTMITVLRLDDGREVIVNHVIDRAIYSASIEISPDAETEDFTYRDDPREILRILTIRDEQLVQIHVEGPWDELSQVHAQLLEQQLLGRQALEQFIENGHLLEPSPARLARGPKAVLCQCLGLTRRAIESAIVHGAITLEDLSRETGVTTVCGGCTSTIASLLGSTGQAVKLAEEIEVSADVRSFRFMPSEATPGDDEIDPEPMRPALPGQHVVISAEVDGAWVHRPYTITSPARCTEWRELTVKREDHGFLSNWLFSQPSNPYVKLSHPKGDFWVDPELRESVVCLVAGIGMTPALALARSIDEAGSDQPLHIDYSARTHADFVYRRELDELAARHPGISVNYRATGGRQHLGSDAVQEIHARLPGARYLVCGPEGYLQAAQALLLEAGVKRERIQVEVFTAVGHAPVDTTAERSLATELHLVATLALCSFYLLQSALGWGLSGLADLQQLVGYRIATGSLLIAFITYQWYLPYLRLAGKLEQTPAKLHRSLGLLAPVLLYLHSVSLGYAYTFVLSLLFVLNTMVGALDKSLVKDPVQRQRFQRVWLLAHVPSSCLITVLALVHIVYTLAYK